MNNEEIKSVHEFDFTLICEYFSSLKRQGPGSDEATLRALSFTDPLLKGARIADIGCGTGTPALTLASHTDGNITSIDLFPTFIDILNQRAHDANLQSRVKGIVGDMQSLPFENDSLDMIWCKRAIYNIGFKRGMNEWRRFLKSGGYIVASEASWFTESRPADIERYWQDAYPEIDTIANKVAVMQRAGYVPVAVFTLPENCWTDNFYIPQKEAQRLFLQQHAGNNTAEELIASQRHEADMYARYHRYYGYAFYIGKKI